MRDRDNSSYCPLKPFESASADQLPFNSIGMAPIPAVSGQGLPDVASDFFDEESNASALKSYAARLKRCGRRFSSPERERTKSRF